MAQGNRKTHKNTRTSPEWGEEYSYYERNKQMAKAHRLMGEHRHGRRPGK
jgi:hypothetical protein